MPTVPAISVTVDDGGQGLVWSGDTPEFRKSLALTLVGSCLAAADALVLLTYRGTTVARFDAFAVDGSDLACTASLNTTELLTAFTGRGALAIIPVRMVVYNGSTEQQVAEGSAFIRNNPQGAWPDPVPLADVIYMRQDVWDADQNGVIDPDHLPLQTAMQTDTFTLDAGDITAKGVELSETADGELLEIDIVSGPETIRGTDYELDTETNMLTWASLGLDGNLSVGDVVVVFYSYKVSGNGQGDGTGGGESLGNPSVDGDCLVSTVAGVRSWATRLTQAAANLLYAGLTHASRHTSGADDIQDATAIQKGLATAAQITKLDAIEAKADVTDAANVEDAITGSAAETTPADAWVMPVVVSAVLKKITFANFKAMFATAAQGTDARTPLAHNQGADTITSGTLDGDRLPALSTTKKGGVPATGTPAGKYLRDDGTWQSVAGGGGDVVGPAGATDGRPALFDGVTGKLLKQGSALGSAAYANTTDFDAAGAAANAQSASTPAAHAGAAVATSHSGIQAPTAENDFLCGNASPFGSWMRKTLAEVKTILGLGSAAYAATTDFATAAQGTDARVPTAAGLASVTHAATLKESLADADEIAIADSAATYGLKHVLWSLIKGTFALLAHGHSGTTDGSKLTQANTHESADTDNAAASLHHTIGTGQYNAAAGNHGHSDKMSNTVAEANSLLYAVTDDTPAALALAANKFAARSSTGDIVAKDITDFALTLLDDAAAANARTTLAAAPLAAVRHYWLPAGAGIPREATKPLAETVDSGDQDVFYDVYSFDSDTDEFLAWVVSLPHWGLGTVKFKPVWTAASSTGDVIWGCQARCYSNDDALNQAQGTAQTSTDTLITAGDVHVGPASAAITVAGTPAVDQAIVVQVYRDANAGGDTLAADARLLGVWIEYTEAATEETAW